MNKYSLIFALALASSLMAAPPVQNTIKPKEPNILMTAKEARKAADDNLNAIYMQNKTACDDSLSFANDKIREASERYQTQTRLNYAILRSSSSQSSGWNGYYYNTFCPLPIIVNALMRNGYTVGVQSGMTENHLVVSW